MARLTLARLLALLVAVLAMSAWPLTRSGGGTPFDPSEARVMSDGATVTMDPRMCLMQYTASDGTTGAYVGDYANRDGLDLGREAAAWQRACRKNPRYRSHAEDPHILPRGSG